MNRKKVGTVPTNGFEPGPSCLLSDCAKPCTPKPVSSYIITLLRREAKSKLRPKKFARQGVSALSLQPFLHQVSICIGFAH